MADTTDALATEPAVRAYADSMLAVLEGLGLPGFVIAEGNVLVAVAPAAMALFDSLFHLVGGKVACRAPGLTPAFETFLAPFAVEHGAPGRVPAPRLLRLPRDAAHGILVRGQDVANPFAARLTAVLLMEETQRSPLSPEVLRQLYQLTQSEARLAVHLYQGLTLNEVSEREGVRLSTLRTQLLSIFSKTGTHRQAELVSRLGRCL